MSRSARPSPFGKRTSKVQTKVSQETKEKLGERWRALGYATESEYCAELLECAAHGVEEVLKLQENRLLAIVGMGQQKPKNGT